MGAPDVTQIVPEESLINDTVCLFLVVVVFFIFSDVERNQWKWILNCDIDAVSNWAKEDKMKMHPAKTKFSITSTRQKIANSAKQTLDLAFCWRCIFHNKKTAINVILIWLIINVINFNNKCKKYRVYSVIYCTSPPDNLRWHSI